MGARGKGAKPLGPPARKPRIRRKGLTRADVVIAWIETLPITSGMHAGRKMKLRPWQREFVRKVYDPAGSDGRRLVRTALLSMGRKNGKTGLAAALALCHLLGPEAEKRGQVYSAAADRKQASILFAEMEAIVLARPDLAARCNIRRFTKDIEDSITGSRYVALSADAKLAHGLNPSMVVYDELAQAPDRRLYDALGSAMGARAEPLMIVISTQAERDDHVLSELVDHAEKIAASEIEDPTFVGVVYAAPADADPWAESTWYLANPALGDFRSLEEMRAYASRARTMPSLEASFRALYLNQRTAAEAGLFSRGEWQACGGRVDPAELQGQPCFGGLDLSSTRDLTAFTLWFPASGAVLAWHWLPGDDLPEREIRDSTPWCLWLQQGHLETTSGKTVDKRHVAMRLAEICAGYEVTAIGYDRWGMPELQRALADEGITLPLREHGQGFKDMTGAIARLEVEVVEHRLRHGGNPILNMCAANAKAIRDPAGNRKLDKKSDTRRIDGVIALCMAMGIAGREPPPVKMDFSRPLVLGG
ncbi:MAG: terminase TerL endonuclease subunit [Geminicoccaceae bacterium]